MSEPTIINELNAWLQSLSPGFIFLLTLPFLVAVAGLLRERFSGEARAMPTAVKERGGDFWAGIKSGPVAKKHLDTENLVHIGKQSDSRTKIPTA